MGKNLLLNIADRGFRPAGYDHTPEKFERLQRELSAADIGLARSPGELAGMLRRPRAVLLLVPAGEAVDEAIDALRPHLDPGDVIADCGNSYFRDTDRRSQVLDEVGIHYLGVGVSGGEDGARHGPSLMPGGSEDGWRRVQRIFESIAARAGGQPCVAYLGPGSAGHYVKMVHNGIEYAFLELIAECYDLMHRALDFDNDALHAVFKRWNETELQSYLIEITADIFLQPDDRGTGRLIDAIRDRAGQKGTGKWVVQDALDLSVPVPTLACAVTMRDLSSDEATRAAIAAGLPEPALVDDPAPEPFVEQLEKALHTALVITFAEGMAALAAASHAYHYGFNLATVARIWRGGCIIRAALLEKIAAAFQAQPNLPNLLLAPDIAPAIGMRQPALREVVRSAASLGIPAPGFMSALSYLDAYRSPHLPANLIQAQRDYFGAHTYERIDREGSFHTEWARR